MGIMEVLAQGSHLDTLQLLWCIQLLVKDLKEGPLNLFGDCLMQGAHQETLHGPWFSPCLIKWSMVKVHLGPHVQCTPRATPKAIMLFMTCVCRFLEGYHAVNFGSLSRGFWVFYSHLQIYISGPFMDVLPLPFYFNYLKFSMQSYSPKFISLSSIFTLMYPFQLKSRIH